MINKDVVWRIYYADGSTFSNLDGEPCAAPAIGVIAIAQQHDEPGERPYIQHMTDYYIWLGTRWLACDQFRLWQYLFVDNNKYDFSRACLGGETIPSRRYVEIRKLAKRDKDIFG